MENREANNLKIHRSRSTKRNRSVKVVLNFPSDFMFDVLEQSSNFVIRQAD